MFCLKVRWWCLIKSKIVERLVDRYIATDSLRSCNDYDDANRTKTHVYACSSIYPIGSLLVIAVCVWKYTLTPSCLCCTVCLDVFFYFWFYNRHNVGIFSGYTWRGSTLPCRCFVDLLYILFLCKLLKSLFRIFCDTVCSVTIFSYLENLPIPNNNNNL